MQSIHVGDHVRINALHISHFRGKLGIVTEVERDTRHRSEWDMCAVVIESRLTQYFPAFALDSVGELWNETRAA